MKKKELTHYCKDCGHGFIAPESLEDRLAFLCPDCASPNWMLIPQRSVGLFGDKDDFSRERDPTTGKDGRYMPQLAKYPGDPRAVVRHVKDVVEIAKKRNLGVERW